MRSRIEAALPSESDGLVHGLGWLALALVKVVLVGFKSTHGLGVSPADVMVAAALFLLGASKCLPATSQPLAAYLSDAALVLALVVVAAVVFAPDLVV